MQKRNPPHPLQKEGPFLPGLKARGILGRFGETMVASLTRRGFLRQAGGAAVTAATAGSLLSACGSNSTSANPVTLTFGWWSNGPVKDNAMKAWAQSFTKTHPTITIKPEILSWNDYWD